MESQFTLNDFRKQMAMVASPGLKQKMIKMIKMINRFSGSGDMMSAMDDLDESEMNSLFGIIDSMTPSERYDAKLINQNRRRRFAKGAGCEPHQVNELIKQYGAMAQMMTDLADGIVRGQSTLLPPSNDDDEDDDPPPEAPFTPFKA